MSFWKRLFGGAGAGAEAGAPAVTREAEHGGYLIRATPFKEGGQYQTAGVILKEVDGVVKEHRFIRADRFASLDDASEFSLAKGRQIIEQNEGRVFDLPT